jgi:hypothetical protein
VRSHGKASPAAFASAGSTTRGNGSAFSLGVLGAMLVCAAAFLGIGAPAAGAATAVDSFKFGPVFGNPGRSGDFLPGPSEVAVDQATGRIFLAETQYQTVAIYSPDPFAGGTPLATPDFTDTGVLSIQNVAVDSSNGDLYFSDPIYTDTLAKAESNGASPPEYSVDATFAPPAGAIVDAGAMVVDPVSHDLLVADVGSNEIVRLDSTDGSKISSFDGSDTGAPIQHPTSIAVSPTGVIYVVDGEARVEGFSSGGVSQGALPLPGEAVPSAVAINPVSGAIAVLFSEKGQSYIQGFSAGETPTFLARTTAVAPSHNFGMAWDGTSGRIYLALGDGTIRTLLPAKQPGIDPPSVTTGRNTAHVSTEIAPGELGPSGEGNTARFEYCPASEPCDDFPIYTQSQANPWSRGPAHTEITTTTTIEDDLPLASNSSWKVRVTAFSESVEGIDRTTPAVDVVSPLLSPGVTTGNAASVTESAAELTGTIDTLGDQTTYHFEYGTSTAYGEEAPLGTEPSAGNNRKPRTVTQAIAGLQPGTTYHYRLVAINSAGEALGEDRTFATLGAGEGAPVRAYEQVTPVDKEGVQIASEAHVQIDPHGAWIAVAASSGGTSDEGVRMRQNYRVRREADGWGAWSPIEAPQKSAEGLFESSTMAVSADGNHALVGSNRALAPGGFEGGGNLYVKDLRTGAYTFLAGAPGLAAYQLLVSVQLNETIFIAGAPDFSWIEFFGPVPFISDPGLTGAGLYRWSSQDGLSILSQIPDPLDPTANIVVPAVQTPSIYKLDHRSASADGDIVAFGVAGGAVYRRAGGVSTPVSVSHLAGDPQDPQVGHFDGMSDDGRYVFFDTPTHLTDDTPADIGGQDALYRYDAVTGDLVYTMPTAGSNTEAFYGISDDGSTVYGSNAEGVNVWRNGVLRNVTSERLSETVDKVRMYITHSGRYFTWMGFDEQVHLYDADTLSNVCVSCSTNGAVQKAAHITVNGRSIGNTRPRVTAEDGTTFFDTATPLVSADTNGKRDVYSYKDGRLTLISPGNDNFDAIFVGADDEGRDVYFQTDQALVSQDTDGSTDVYDARVGGGFASQNPPPPPAECVRSSCGETSAGPVSSPPVMPRLPAGKNSAAGRKVTVGGLKSNGRAVTVRFHASAAGRVKVSGSSLQAAAKKVPKAGTYSITTALTKKARERLRSGTRVKVVVKLTLSGGGETVSAKYSKTLGK